MLYIPEKFENSFLAAVPEGKKILLFGAGGGFDIISCLPLYYTLRMKGHDVELANFSMVDFDLFPALAEPHAMNNDILGTNALIKGITDHFPEGHLSAWFKEGFQEEVSVWMFRKQPIAQVGKNMKVLVDKLDVGAIILCGAGMRSIMIGDEEGCGEMLFSSIVLGAVKQLEIPSCIFTMGINTHGNKRSESLYSAMENMQNLVLDEAYYGGCILEKDQACFQYYKSAYEYVVSQPKHVQSPVHEMIITSVMGGFGPHKDGGFVCSNMSDCHFFDAITAANLNLIIPHLEPLDDFDHTVQIGLNLIQSNNKRSRVAVPA